MILMTDTNGDGVLSRDEFPALHGRMFKFLDTGGNGQLILEETRKRWFKDDDDDWQSILPRHAGKSVS